MSLYIYIFFNKSHISSIEVDPEIDVSYGITCYILSREYPREFSFYGSENEFGVKPSAFDVRYRAR